MSDRNDSIETRIDEALHDLLDYMDDETNYSDEYKSMFGQLSKVLEIRQKESDSKKAREIKIQELQQQLSISEATNAIKLQELQQQKTISEESHGLKMAELHQQKTLSDDANAIKLEELALKKTITKEALLNVGTHVAGLIVLMNHERAHVIASKAFGLVKKIF